LLPAGATVLVIGGEGLRSAVVERGFRITDTDADHPDAVAQGYGPEVSWRMLAEAALAVQRGVPWVATNLDATLPSPRGLLPGNGALVSAVVTATGRVPVSAGKPELPLHEEAVRRARAQRPLVVGDRLDTDIEGAVRARCDSLLVLSGVTDAAHVLTADPDKRPTYLARDLRGLGETHPSVRVVGDSAQCSAWRAERRGDTIEVQRVQHHDADGDTINALRALVTLSWSGRTDDVRLAGDRDALHDLGLEGFAP
jgi:ribonucleotide monophosphatase NagD (HAD superfamily)